MEGRGKNRERLLYRSTLCQGRRSVGNGNTIQSGRKHAKAWQQLAAKTFICTGRVALCLPFHSTRKRGGGREEEKKRGEGKKMVEAIKQRGLDTEPAFILSMSHHVYTKPQSLKRNSAVSLGKEKKEKGTLVWGPCLAFRSSDVWRLHCGSGADKVGPILGGLNQLNFLARGQRMKTRPLPSNHTKHSPKE